MRWVIKEVEPPPHDSAAEDRSAEMRLGSVTAAILRYDLVASPMFAYPTSLPWRWGSVRGAAAIRGIPRLTLGMAGDLFRRLIKPLFGYLLFVRFNELSLGQFGLNLNFCRGIPRSILFGRIG